METHSKESMAKSLSHAAYCRQKYQELPIELKNIKVSWMDSAKRWLQMVKSNRD